MCLQSRCCHRTGETKGIIPPGFLEGGCRPAGVGAAAEVGEPRGRRHWSVSREERERYRKRRFAGGTENRGLMPDGLDLTAKAGGRYATEKVRGQEPKERKGLRRAGGRASGPAVPMRSELAQQRSGQEHGPRRDPEPARGRLGPRWAGRQGRGEGLSGTLGTLARGWGARAGAGKDGGSCTTRATSGPTSETEPL